MYISLDSPKNPTSSNGNHRLTDDVLGDRYMPAWLVSVLRQLHSESGRSLYDDEFYSWIKREWGITPHIGYTPSGTPVLMGANIDDSMFTLLLIKFPND